MMTSIAVIVVLAVCSVKSQPTSAQYTLTIGMNNKFRTRVNERNGQMTECASVMGTQPQTYVAKVSILCNNCSAMGKNE